MQKAIYSQSFYTKIRSIGVVVTCAVSESVIECMYPDLHTLNFVYAPALRHE